jgi:hypothetical protein
MIPLGQQTVCLDPGELIAPGQKKTFTGIWLDPDAVPVAARMVNATWQTFGTIPPLGACH